VHRKLSGRHAGVSACHFEPDDKQSNGATTVGLLAFRAVLIDIFTTLVSPRVLEYSTYSTDAGRSLYILPSKQTPSC